MGWLKNKTKQQKRQIKKVTQLKISTHTFPWRGRGPDLNSRSCPRWRGRQPGIRTQVCWLAALGFPCALPWFWTGKSLWVLHSSAYKGIAVSWVCSSQAHPGINYGNSKYYWTEFLNVPHQLCALLWLWWLSKMHAAAHFPLICSHIVVAPGSKHLVC